MVAASSRPLTSPYAAPRIASRQGAPVVPALDTAQIFHLIDRYLPFEVCLHYQLLPLEVDRDRVHLGMVDPHDRSALEYAVRMAQYWNYRLIPKPISSDSLNTILAAYLNFLQLQGPAAHQEKLRQASQVAKANLAASTKTCHAHPMSSPSLASPPPKTMLMISDETMILDESEMMTIEAQEASVVPLSGNATPVLTLATSDPSPPPPPAMRPTPQPPQEQLDQLGKTALHLTRQLRQAMHSLQAYGTEHPAQAQRRQQAIVALGRDLHQINQDFKGLLQAIATQQVS